MLAIQHGVSMLPPRLRQRPRILGAEGITPLSMILRTLTPYYLPSEYLPKREETEKHFPIQHLDLMDIQLPANSFDLFFSAHVLDHVPDVGRAIQQVSKVIKPGGILVSTFPFDPDRENTVTKARLDASGSIEYLTEPEYHKNPVQQKEGSLVFQLPGWDVLDTCRAAGLTEAALVMFASSVQGVLGRKGLGAFALLARKPIDGDAREMKAIRQRREW